MKATSKEQADLLELQRLELQLLRAAHQTKTHPLREKLAALSGRAEDLRRFGIALGAEITDQRRQAQWLEQEIDKVNLRGDAQRKRLEGGKVPAKETNAVEHELKTIDRRRNELERQLKEVTAAINAKENALSDSQAQADALRADEEKTRAAMAAQQEGPAAATAQMEQDVAALRGSLPSSVLAEYERMVERQGLPVVVELSEGALVNSPISLSAGELADIMARPVDELVIIEESGYLIARP